MKPTLDTHAPPQPGDNRPDSSQPESRPRREPLRDGGVDNPPPVNNRPPVDNPLRRVLWLVPPLFLVAAFFLYPLYFVARESLTGAPNAPGEPGAPGPFATWHRVLTSGRFLDALGNTVGISLAATLGCVLLGTFFATVLAFVPFPGAALVTRLVDTLLAFPSFLIALAFTFLYGSAGILDVGPGFLYSPWCVIAAEITFYTPFVMRPLLAAYSHVPREQLDVAASLGARPARVFARIVLPEALPALAAGGCLTLLLTLNEFGIVLFIGAKDVTTLPMLVHSYGVVTFDLPAACVVAVVQVALSLALYAVYRRAFQKGR